MLLDCCSLLRIVRGVGNKLVAIVVTVAVAVADAAGVAAGVAGAVATTVAVADTIADHRIGNGSGRNPVGEVGNR